LIEIEVEKVLYTLRCVRHMSYLSYQRCGEEWNFPLVNAVPPISIKLCSPMRFWHVSLRCGGFGNEGEKKAQKRCELSAHLSYMRKV